MLALFPGISVPEGGRQRVIKSNLFLQTKFLLRVISAVLGGDGTEPAHMLSAQFCKTREREREKKCDIYSS